MSSFENLPNLAKTEAGCRVALSSVEQLKNFDINAFKKSYYEDMYLLIDYSYAQLMEKLKFGPSHFKVQQIILPYALHSQILDIYSNRFMPIHPTGSGKTRTILCIGKGFLSSEQKRHMFIIGPYSDRFLQEILKAKNLKFLRDNEFDEFSKLYTVGKKTAVERKLADHLYNHLNMYINTPETFAKVFLGVTSLDLDNDEKIKFDMTIAKQLYNSMWVFDESQELFNKQRFNKYGFIALLLNKLYGSNIKMIFCSATPLFYSTSIARLVYLIHHDNKEYRNVEDILKVLTEINGLPTKKRQLEFINKLVDEPIKIENTKDLFEMFKWKISFLPSDKSNVRDYAKPNYFGEVPGWIEDNFHIPIKVEEIEMSDKQMKLAQLVQSYSDKENKKNTEDNKNMSVIKNMNYYNFGIEYSDLKTVVEIAKTKDLVYVADPTKLQNYSTKYSKMVEIIRKTHGKVLVFSEDVSGTGTKFIGTVLQSSGLIEYESGSNAGEMKKSFNSICYKCRKDYRTHTTTKLDHDFKPIVFALLHGELDDQVRSEVMAAFETPKNDRGEVCMVLVISRAFQTGYDYSCVIETIHVDPYASINMMRQALGRTIRYLSHERLPPEQRVCNIHLLYSKSKNEKIVKNEITFLEETYTDGKLVMMIEKLFSLVSLDSIWTHEIKDDWMIGNIEQFDNVFGEMRKRVGINLEGDVIAMHKDISSTFFLDFNIVEHLKYIFDNFSPHGGVVSYNQIVKMLEGQNVFTEGQLFILRSDIFKNSLYILLNNQNLKPMIFNGDLYIYKKDHLFSKYTAGIKNKSKMNSLTFEEGASQETNITLTESLQKKFGENTALDIFLEMFNSEFKTKFEYGFKFIKSYLKLMTRMNSIYLENLTRRCIETLTAADLNTSVKIVEARKRLSHMNGELSCAIVVYYYLIYYFMPIIYENTKIIGYIIDDTYYTFDTHTGVWHQSAVSKINHKTYFRPAKNNGDIGYLSIGPDDVKIVRDPRKKSDSRAVNTGMNPENMGSEQLQAIYSIIHSVYRNKMGQAALEEFELSGYAKIVNKHGLSKSEVIDLIFLVSVNLQMLAEMNSEINNNVDSNVYYTYVQKVIEKIR